MAHAVLLVDDSTEFREEFCDYFEEYTVVQASDGKKALEILRKPHEIAVVVLDVDMPGLRGTEVLLQIKELAPELSVVILTGHSTKEVAIEALKGHADDFIEKPLDLDKARAILDRLLDIRRRAAGPSPEETHATVTRVKQFVEQNYRQRVSLEDAAALVFLSPKYVSRIFKEDTGKSFVEYRSEVKVERAKELLRKTRQTVEKIAVELGYGNTESFIRAFKKVAGRTPTEYRREGPARREGAHLREGGAEEAE